MCDIGFHICGCGAEYQCYSHNNECPVMNGYEEHCAGCEVVLEDIERDLERDERRKWEISLWEEQFRGYYEP